MNEQYFQVNVEMVTPACDANCPNLQIDIKDLNYVVNNIDNLPKLIKIRCANAEYCKRINKVLRKYEEHIEGEIQRAKRPDC